MDNNQSSASQFRPVGPPLQGQPFMPVAHQQFRPHMQMPPAQFSQPMQQMPLPWQNHPSHVAPSSQPVPMPYVHQNRPPPQMQQNASFVPSSFGQLQPNAAPLPQFQSMPQMQPPVAPAGGGQPWLPSPSPSNGLSTTPVQPTGQQLPVSSSDAAVNVPNQHSSSDWQEHTASDGRRYYYNKRTKQSSWEKPLELMTPIERADASTVWKEFATPDGKKYYYNKVTKQSKWTIPEELKFARELAQQTASQGTQSEIDAASHTPVAVNISMGETSTTAIPVSSSSSSTPGVVSSPVQVTPVVAVSNPAVVVPSSPALPTSHSTLANAAGAAPSAVTMTVLPTAGSNSVAATVVNAKPSVEGFDSLATPGAVTSLGGVPLQTAEDMQKGAAVAIKSDANSREEKTSDDEPLVFASKLEAKNAFKALLEFANVRSDWTWEQTMREIINDKRYHALKTPGERKQAFNEYLNQRRKIEAEERRIRQKRAREEFTKMLEESKELTSSMKWSKAVSLFENDERFNAVEKPRDREDLFDIYIVELGRKEREQAAEDHRKNLAEFKKFLESCDFIKVNSHWRKVQDRLEDDERCSRLEKLDRLLVFQDYIRDLEKEEEDQKRMQKEQLRRTERKNRDAFRKLLEDHVADGSLTAKTHWLDYCPKVKGLPQYLAVATNTSGSTPKDLFEDVVDDLDKQYRDEKSRVKDAMKLSKITMVSTWTLQDFKGTISDVNSPPISDINLKLIYDELLERVKEKEEKEAKKRQRLLDDLTAVLSDRKEITASSSWEDCKPLFEESEEYKAIGEESLSREIFEEYVARLKEKAKEKERKREEEKVKKEKEREEKDKRKERDRKEKEKEREREKGKERTKKDEPDNDDVDATESYGHKEEKKREKDKDRKHRKRHQSDDVSSDKDEKEESKRSRRHGSDRKKSRKHSRTPESGDESRHKKHKRDQRDGSRRSGEYNDLEDGEVGEDGELVSMV